MGVEIGEPFEQGASRLAAHAAGGRARGVELRRDAIQRRVGSLAEDAVDARGGQAHQHALEMGRPGFAAVDVYEEEPIVNGNHPFLSMPNVLCMPHLGWAEWPNFELYFRETFEQIVAFENGASLRLANPDVVPRR